MNELTVTYKGVTIKETYAEPLDSYSYETHLNQILDIIDKRSEKVVGSHSFRFSDGPVYAKVRGLQIDSEGNVTPL